MSFTCGGLHHGAGFALTAASHREHRHIVVPSTWQVCDGTGGATFVAVVSGPSVTHCFHIEVFSIGVGGPGHDHGPVSTLSFHMHTLGCTGGCGGERGRKGVIELDSRLFFGTIISNEFLFVTQFEFK